MVCSLSWWFGLEKNLFPSSPTWLQARLHFLLPIAVRASKTCCMSPHPPMAARFLKACKPTGQEGESEGKKKVTCFGNLIMKVTAYHLCHILSVRIKSLSAAHTEGEMITQGHEHQEADH